MCQAGCWCSIDLGSRLCAWQKLGMEFPQRGGEHTVPIFTPPQSQSIPYTYTSASYSNQRSPGMLSPRPEPNDNLPVMRYIISSASVVYIYLYIVSIDNGLRFFVLSCWPTKVTYLFVAASYFYCWIQLDRYSVFTESNWGSCRDAECFSPKWSNGILFMLFLFHSGKYSAPFAVA